MYKKEKGKYQVALSGREMKSCVCEGEGASFPAEFRPNVDVRTEQSFDWPRRAHAPCGSRRRMASAWREPSTNVSNRHPQIPILWDFRYLLAEHTPNSRLIASGKRVLVRMRLESLRADGSRQLPTAPEAVHVLAHAGWRA